MDPTQQQPAVETVDRFSARAIVLGMIVLTAGLIVGQFVITLQALSKPPEQAITYMGLAQGFANLTGVALGGLVYAMTLRSGGNVKQLGETVALTRGESMSAGVIPTNPPHDPLAGSAAAQALAQQPVVVSIDPNIPGPTPPTL